MPEIVGEPMDAEREKQLREWMRKPEAKNFRMVLLAKIRFDQEQALADAMKSDGVNGFDWKANASMMSARRYDTALEVFDQLSDSPTPFLIPKFKP